MDNQILFVLTTLHILGMMFVESSLYLEIKLEDYQNIQNEVVQAGMIRCCVPSEELGKCATSCSANITIFVSIPRTSTVVIRHIDMLPSLPSFSFTKLMGKFSNPLFIIFDESQKSFNVTVRVTNAYDINQLIIESSITAYRVKTFHLLRSKITQARLGLSTSTKICSTKPRGQCLADGTFQCFRGWEGQNCSSCSILYQRWCYPGVCKPDKDSKNVTCDCPAGYILNEYRCVIPPIKTTTKSINSKLSTILKRTTKSVLTKVSEKDISVETAPLNTSRMSTDIMLVTSSIHHTSKLSTSTESPASSSMTKTTEIISTTAASVTSSKDSHHKQSKIAPQQDTKLSSSGVSASSEPAFSSNFMYSRHFIDPNTRQSNGVAATSIPPTSQSLPTTENKSRGTKTRVKRTESSSESQTSISTLFPSGPAPVESTTLPISKTSYESITTSNIATSNTASHTSKKTKCSHSITHILFSYVPTESSQFALTKIPSASAVGKKETSLVIKTDSTLSERVTRIASVPSWKESTKDTTNTLKMATETKTKGSSAQTSLILNFTGPPDLGKVRQSLTVLASVICPGTKKDSVLTFIHQIDSRDVQVSLVCSGKPVTRAQLRNQIESLSKEELGIMFPNINDLNLKDTSTKPQVTNMSWLSSNWQLVLGISLGVSSVLIITVIVMVCKRWKATSQTHGRYVDDSVQDEEDLGMTYLSPVYNIYNPADEDA